MTWFLSYIKLYYCFNAYKEFTWPSCFIVCNLFKFLPMFNENTSWLSQLLMINRKTHICVHICVTNFSIQCHLYVFLLRFRGLWSVLALFWYRVSIIYMPKVKWLCFIPLVYARVHTNPAQSTFFWCLIGACALICCRHQYCSICLEMHSLCLLGTCSMFLPRRAPVHHRLHASVCLDFSALVYVLTILSQMQREMTTSKNESVCMKTTTIDHQQLAQKHYSDVLL